MRVSAIVLCKNQTRNIYKIIRALACQTVRPDEVIVVDDRSNDAISEIAPRLGARLVSTSAHLLNTAEGARALARQLAAEEAQCSALAYLDGDMIPAPCFIEGGLHALRRAPLVKIWREYRIATSGQLIRNQLPATIGGGQSDIAYSQFTSDSFMVRREASVTVGGWDENFRGWGEEDIEFAYRFKQAGFRIGSSRGPQIFATHLDHAVDERANFASLLRNARYFAAKHPAVASEREPFWRAIGLYENAYRQRGSGEV